MILGVFRLSKNIHVPKAGDLKGCAAIACRTASVTNCDQQRQGVQAVQTATLILLKNFGKISESDTQAYICSPNVPLPPAWGARQRILCQSQLAPRLCPSRFLWCGCIEQISTHHVRTHCSTFPRDRGRAQRAPHAAGDRADVAIANPELRTTPLRGVAPSRHASFQRAAGDA